MYVCDVRRGPFLDRVRDSLFGARLWRFRVLLPALVSMCKSGVGFSGLLELGASQLPRVPDFDGARLSSVTSEVAYLKGLSAIDGPMPC